jgi:hypothetical protein
VDNRKYSALYWAPRIIGIGAALFLAIFALDVFSEGYQLGELLVALFIHLIPSLVIIIVLVIAWRWERFGGGLFIFLGLLYIWLFWNPGRWIAFLVISGPLFISGGLFLLNHWIAQGEP